MNTRDYLMTYTNELLSKPDIGFFHGNFDVVLNKSIDMSELMKGDTKTDSLITSVTFPLSYFQKIIKYCWIGGHWHDGIDYGNVHYTGSATRWIHGEDEPKGIGFVNIDTDSPEYFYKKILNPIAPFYVTEEICPDDFDDDFIEDLDSFIKKIDEKILLFRMANLEYHIKIIFYENEKTIKSQNMLDEVKRGILLLPQTNLVVKTKKKHKKNDKSKSKTDKDYSFIKDKNLSISKMIYEFIKVKTGEEVPYEYIERYVKKYSK